MSCLSRFFTFLLIVPIIASNSFGQCHMKVRHQESRPSCTFYQLSEHATAANKANAHKGALRFYYKSRAKDTLMNAEIRNLSKEVVMELELTVRPGTNWFVIDLKGECASLKIDTDYILTLPKLKGVKKHLYFVYGEEKPDLQFDITLGGDFKPVKDCDLPLEGTFTSGMEGVYPITAHWYVTSSGEEADSISCTGCGSEEVFNGQEVKPGEGQETHFAAPPISPVYYVVLEATDGCGVTRKQTAFINCRKKRKGNFEPGFSNRSSGKKSNRSR